MSELTKMLKHWMTAADGETYAVGRMYSVLFTLAGLALPILMLCFGQKIALNELAVYIPALAGAVTLLVSGTNMTEPK